MKKGRTTRWKEGLYKVRKEGWIPRREGRIPKKGRRKERRNEGMKEG